jgi:hypothetical protein
MQMGDRVINPFFDWPLITPSNQRNAALEDLMDELLEGFPARV